MDAKTRQRMALNFFLIAVASVICGASGAVLKKFQIKLNIVKTPSVAKIRNHNSAIYGFYYNKRILTTVAEKF